MAFIPSDDHECDGQGGETKKDPSGDAMHSNLGDVGGIGRKPTPNTALEARPPAVEAAAPDHTGASDPGS